MVRNATVIGKEDVEQPPQAPSVARRIRIPPYRLITLLALAIFVILAAFGVFGLTQGNVSAVSGDRTLRAEHPTRIRYKQADVMRVFITNVSNQALPLLTVTFDEIYLDAFSNVTFTPSASHIWQVELRDVEPGETRQIQVELQGERYWRHEGSIAATADGLATATLEVSTITYP